MSMLENLADIQEHGVQAFLERERAGWTCADCGGVVCVHREKCLFCGHPVLGGRGEQRGRG